MNIIIIFTFFVTSFIFASCSKEMQDFPEIPDNTRFVNNSDGDDEGGTNLCDDLDDPCLTISHAIEMSAKGDMIKIADGIYTESLKIDKSLTLQGESEAGTIIQAHEEPFKATERVITIIGKLEVKIAGLTIRNGVAETSFGGGIYNSSINLTLFEVTLTGNFAGNGGGMWNQTGLCTLTNVTFNSNSAITSGGGMYNNQDSSILKSVTFKKNSAAGRGKIDGGGGLSSWGSKSLLILTDVVFEENTTHVAGGGMRITGGGAKLKNVIFLANDAGQWGGGMFLSHSSPTLVNVKFYGNSSDRGGGMYNWKDASPTLTNVTFTGNSVRLGSGGGGLRNTENSSVRMVNSIIWGNTSSSGEQLGVEIYNAFNANTELSYCIVRNRSDIDILDLAISTGVEFRKCTYKDPLFLAPGNGDLRPKAGSPAINAGNPATDLAVFPTGKSGNPIALDGKPRMVGGRIDLGVYEYQDD